MDLSDISQSEPLAARRSSQPLGSYFEFFLHVTHPKMIPNSYNSTTRGAMIKPIQ